jgi:hypothetical protein
VHNDPQSGRPSVVNEDLVCVCVCVCVCSGREESCQQLRG